MKTIPRYWGHAETEVGILVWRSSSTSQAEAEEEARKAARRVSEYEKTTWSDKRPPAEEYPYGVTLREKLLEEIEDSHGRLQGFVTRNHAGARVLNVRNVMFLDWDTPTVDFPSLKGCLLGLFAWIGQLFGRPSEPIPELRQVDPLKRNPKTGIIGYEKPNPEWVVRTPESWEEQYPWAAVPELWAFMSEIVTMPDWSVRIYKTTAGYRGIATHALFDPTDRETIRLMERFDCDPQYVRLCKRQESFRARLTPKGWRCGLWPDKLPQHFQFYYPFTNDFYYTPLTLATYLLPSNASAEETRRRYEKYDPKREHLVAMKDEPGNFQKELISLYQEQYEEAEEIYEKAAASFATCRYLGTVGNEFVHPDVRPILDLHDEATKALSREELALA